MCTNKITNKILRRQANSHGSFYFVCTHIMPPKETCTALDLIQLLCNYVYAFHVNYYYSPTYAASKNFFVVGYVTYKL